MSNTSEQMGSRVKELFLEALELEGPDREEFVRLRCGTRGPLRERVEALLRTQISLGETFLSPAPPVPVEDDRIDRYELLEILGEGGFGTVYRAVRRDGIQTPVAIKVLRAGMESQEALARFRTERFMLEAMDHPGIARILDAGLTARSRPFIVMELVKGIPITEFCDQERLSVRRRTALMIDVCRAVQHAHQKGVVHRDLKPTNILAWHSDGQDRVKVIDFGIARAIEGAEPRTPGITRLSQRLGTPAYMSPEQARPDGKGIDTRTDIYAIGAVLYELLCGEPVVGLSAPSEPSEVERLICEASPPSPAARLAHCQDGERRAWNRGTKPGRFPRILGRELWWIIQRAIEKDRARRFNTAEAMAEDLERCLDGRPVAAAPPSRLYLASRWTRRNLGLAAGLAVAGAAIVLATGWSIRESMRARAAERIAQHQREIADAINKFLREDLLEAVSPQGHGHPARGKEVTVREVLDEASRRIDAASGAGGSLEHQPSVQAGVRRSLAETYFELGVLDLADRHGRIWLELEKRELGAADAETLTAQVSVGIIAGARGHAQEAVEIMSDALNSARQSHGSEAEVTLFAEDSLGTQYTSDPAKTEESERLLRHVFDVRQRQLGFAHPETLGAGSKLAHALGDLGRIEESLELAQRVRTSSRAVRGEDHPETLWSTLEVARSLLRFGDRRIPEAEELMAQVYRSRASVLGETHIDTIKAAQELGEIELRSRRLTQAEQWLRVAYELCRRALGEDSEETIHCESMLGETLARMGKFDEGLGLVEDAADRMERGPGDAMRDAGWVRLRVRDGRLARDRGEWR